MWLVMQEGAGFYVYHSVTLRRVRLPPQDLQIAEALARSLNLGERDIEQTIFDLEAQRRSQGS